MSRPKRKYRVKRYCAKCGFVSKTTRAPCPKCGGRWWTTRGGREKIARSQAEREVPSE